MIFAVDIGNTNIVCGIIKDDKIIFSERMSTDRGKNDVEYAVLIKTIIELHNINYKDIEGTIIASVVPELTGVLKSCLDKLFETSALVVGPGLKTGLNIKIDNPAQLGADLVVAAVAAIEYYPCPQIIFDLGTATTISAIDKDGGFLGVIISAGVYTSVNSLVSNTSQLQRIALNAPEKVIGKNTIESMQSGAIYGTASMIDGMIDRVSDEMNDSPTVIATGGIASSIVKSCKHDIIVDDELLLKGLNIIFKKNS